MPTSSWFLELDQTHLDYVVLGGLALLALLAWLLVHVGVVGWAVGALGGVVRGAIRQGFRLWERLLSWAPWPLFLALAAALLAIGSLAAGRVPGLTIVCALLALGMGLLACLAYMFIDLERYEVERGYKAIHNPLKGQELAQHLVRHGSRVGVPLLGSAAVALVGGFALLNEELYHSVGRAWYRVGEGSGPPDFLDFLVNILLYLLRVVDVLHLASSHNLVRATYVHQAAWPASVLLAAFKMLFTLVLLQQIFASVRQGQSLAETIADFWSPHEPIHERARNSLPQYGPGAVGPLLLSLRTAASLTREQREQLPMILAGIGPAALPALVRHLQDPHEHVRAVAVATLGHLRAREAVPLLALLARDPGDTVRRAVAEALAGIAEPGSTTARTRQKLRRLANAAGPVASWLRWRRRRAPAAPADPTALAVGTLLAALDDPSVAVRIQAAASLGRIGPAAAASQDQLIGLLPAGDEALRCAAAEALGRLGGEGRAVAALAALLTDAGAAVRTAAARALGGLKEAAAPAVPALLQDSEESVRTAAAEAIARIGTLGQEATDTVVADLSDRDNVVRARAAEALGTIGASAQEAAPALVEVLRDENDVVRARAVEALGKMGDAAADVAVPGLVRALRDPDNWVSALAAEALGQMGESADLAVPALVRALGHVNPLVRANAAEALGRMGAAAERGRAALEKACTDEDGAVCAQALRALGSLGTPTPAAQEAARQGLQDADPQVRAAALAAFAEWGDAGRVRPGALVALLADANDQVKVEAARVLPRLAGAVPEVIAGLCRQLEEDDSPLVQEHAALALGRLGPPAGAAGEALIRAAQTGEASVREEALRALAMIQPPGAATAFAAGLRDASPEVRKVASAGWLKAAAIPEEAIPELVQALADPDPQIRANAAHALSRLGDLPDAAIPRLVECAADPSDGLRISAALALKAAPPGDVRDVMERLLGDSNVRVRLIAAGSLLGTDPENRQASAIARDALADPAPRVRRSALALIESLGEKGKPFAEAVRQREGHEDDPDAAAAIARLLEHFSSPPEPVKA